MESSMGSQMNFSHDYFYAVIRQENEEGHDSDTNTKPEGKPEEHNEEGAHGHVRGICPEKPSACRLQMPVDCEKEECAENLTMIIFPFIALLIGVVAAPLSRKIRIPYTLLLLGIGMAIGALGCGADLGLLSLSLSQWVHLNPPAIFFHIFLAPLIFEASFNTRWYVFKRLLLPILTAAFVIVILQAGLIAAFEKLVLQTPDWTWSAALMFGAMLSATDPISVTATLKALGASEFLNTLIEGESLVNDGSAFVLWEAFFENTLEEGKLSPGDIVLMVLRLSVGGMLMGVAFGLAALIILGLIYDEYEVETSLTVTVAFLGFWAAQTPSKLSGVICNVASGLVISAFGRHLITPKVRDPLAEFWELLAWVANTIVFVHAGILLIAFTWSCAHAPNKHFDYLHIISWYLYLQVIRIGLILLFRPFMAIGNRWFQWKEALVVGFSGLRGAVSLVLALEVAGGMIPSNVKSRVILWSTGIVALSLMVNGFFIKPLIQTLKLDKANKSREDFLSRGRAVLVQRSLMILDALCVDSAFKQARWSYVVKNCLPEEWLHDKEHREGYVEAMQQLVDNSATARRTSLEHVSIQHRKDMAHSRVHRRLNNVNALEGPVFTNSRDRADSPYMAAYENPSEAATMARLSIGTTAVPNGDMDYDRKRLSIAVDAEQYSGMKRSAEKGHLWTQSRIHSEVAKIHRVKTVAGNQDLTEGDREVQRRLLTAILSHVRALTNASMVELSVLYNLEQDCQQALDANEEGRDYDLFSFLDLRARQRGGAYHAYLWMIEGKELRGQTAITTAWVVLGVLSQIFNAELLDDSPVIQERAEHLYEGAAALLNRLESMNPKATEWVQSQFAVYVSALRQDEVLKDMRESGVIDGHEFNILKSELLRVRRRHVQSRHSPLQWHRHKLPPRPDNKSKLKGHPLFADISPDRLELFLAHGEQMKLTSGQTLQCEKGALAIILEGALRPVEDPVWPEKAEQQMGRNASGSSSNTDDEIMESQIADEPVSRMTNFRPMASGASMHWCFDSNSALVGPMLAINSHGESCDVAHDRTVDVQTCCCEMAGEAVVFVLPTVVVKQMAREYVEFRMEITRSMARELVLESVAAERPYMLSHFSHSLGGGLDVNTVVGRAIRVLERLAYMSVFQVREGDGFLGHVQGPGVLLNGTVKLSIVDTSGLVGAVNLVHERLTGPALLPAGDLVIEQVDDDDAGSDDGVVEKFQLGRENGNRALENSEVLGMRDEYGRRIDRRPAGRVVAHILIEDHEDELAAVQRLHRWTGKEQRIDLNGRFVMNRHIEMTPLTETIVQ